MKLAPKLRKLQENLPTLFPVQRGLLNLHTQCTSIRQGSKSNAFFHDCDREDGGQRQRVGLHGYPFVSCNLTRFSAASYFQKRTIGYRGLQRSLGLQKGCGPGVLALNRRRPRSQPRSPKAWSASMGCSRPLDAASGCLGCCKAPTWSAVLVLHQVRGILIDPN